MGWYGKGSFWGRSYKTRFLVTITPFHNYLSEQWKSEVILYNFLKICLSGTVIIVTQVRKTVFPSDIEKRTYFAFKKFFAGALSMRNKTFEQETYAQQQRKVIFAVS